MQFDLRTQKATTLFICEPIAIDVPYPYSIALNAITIDPRNPNMVATRGDDPFAWVYDIRKYKRDGIELFKWIAKVKIVLLSLSNGSN